MKKLDAKFVYLTSSFMAGFILSIVFAANQLYRVQTVGLDPLQLVLVGTTLEVTAFLFEIPTGVVADVYSRRLSVVIGTFLFGLGFLVEGLFRHQTFPFPYIMLFSEAPPRSNQRKKGPPRRAVITPTGISAGAITVRASVSHRTRKVPPKRNDTGASLV